MYALQGVFKVKVIYLPTPTLVTCVAAFGQEVARNRFSNNPNHPFHRLLEKISSDIPRRQWKEISTAIRFVNRSPVTYQVANISMPIGQRRGRQIPDDIMTKLFSHINKYISSSGEGSDQPINEYLAIGLRRALSQTENEIIVERPHPWLNNIRPDIMININPNKVVCIEMHYTADSRPFVIADYVLDKLRVYMKQLEYYSKSPRLFSDF